MKKILILVFLLLNACTLNPKSEKKPYVTLFSCDNKSCIILMKFPEYSDCLEVVQSLIHLHRDLRKDKPSRLMLCKSSDEIVEMESK